MASSYVNNLRLNEMATGDASGTWGTTTNTNLELVGQALGVGTEGITTNANTHTSTVADGAADEARAMYIKYTGTLDSACTITIGPNTLKRVHIIENATSGSQNIIIKQGSGATVTIGNGNVSVVTLDGAGSGAAVLNAFTDLETAGTITVAGNLIASADATVGDDLSLVSDAAVLGFGADNDVTLTHVADTGLLLNGARQLQFGDSGTHISQSADGTLDLVADTEIEINATTIDMNGALNLSGNALISGEVQTANIGFTDGDNAIVIADGGGITAAAGITSTAASNTFGATSFNDADITNVGSIAVDTIINDGTDIVIDAAGDITLDAAGADVFFGAAGNVGSINMASNDFTISQLQNDKDIIFKGVDNTAAITALTLDMSAAGAATFNDSITLGGNLVHASNLNIDAAGVIVLDADNAGVIQLKDGGTHYGSFFTSSDALNIQSNVNNGEMLFKGVDGGSGITALTLDMSDAGTAGFNAGATFGNSVVVGAASVNAAGSVSLQSDGSIRSVGAAGATFDTLLGAISGVSNGFQILQDTSNNQTYAFHNAGAISLKITAAEIAFNDSSLDQDFRVESNGNANMLFVNGGSNRVGIGTNAPVNDFSVQGASGGLMGLHRTSGSTTGVLGSITVGNTDVDSGMGGIDFTQDGATNSARIGFFTQPSGGAKVEKLRIHSGGVASFATGIELGSGLDATAANTLDDYEEGTWTLTDQSGAGMTLEVFVSEYTKIGNKVYIEIGMVFPSTSSTAEIRLSLPFAAKATADNTAALCLSGTNSGRTDMFVALRNTSLIGAATTSAGAVTNANYSAKNLKMSGFYTVA